MPKRKHTREEAEGQLDLIRGIAKAQDTIQLLNKSLETLLVEKGELFMEYEFVGKLVSGDVEIEPYIVTESCLRSEGLKEACIKIYMTHNDTENRKDAVRSLNQSLGSGWTPANFFDADIELWPYNDRCIKFGHANLIRVIKWGGGSNG